MTTLALDLGTTTGWAVMRDGTIEHCDMWDLSPKRGDSPVQRFLLFRGRLRATRLAYPDVADVVYEDAVGHQHNYAGEIFGGFKYTLLLWCCDNGIRFRGIPVLTLKKWATGKGNAKKSAMVVAACEKTDLVIVDHNVADAVLLALYAAE